MVVVDRQNLVQIVNDEAFLSQQTKNCLLTLVTQVATCSKQWLCTLCSMCLRATNRRTHDRHLGHSPPATNAAVTHAS